jgi:hypothetical protein
MKERSFKEKPKAKNVLKLTSDGRGLSPLPESLNHDLFPEIDINGIIDNEFDG